VVANHPSNERHRASHWQAKNAAEKRWKCRFCRAILPFATETRLSVDFAMPEKVSASPHRRTTFTAGW
jgi:hypothetical protein